MSLDRRCRASSPASASQCSLSIQRPTETAAIHKKRDQNQAQPQKQNRPGSPHSKKLDPLPDHRQYNSFPDLLQSYASSHFGKPFPCRVIAFLREPANPAAKIENPIPALLIRSSLLSRGEFATLPPSDNPHPPAADDSAPTRKSLPAPAPASIHISNGIPHARRDGRLLVPHQNSVAHQLLQMPDQHPLGHLRNTPPQLARPHRPVREPPQNRSLPPPVDHRQHRINRTRRYFLLRNCHSSLHTDNFVSTNI
jgi:hypothetical protein